MREVRAEKTDKNVFLYFEMFMLVLNLTKFTRLLFASTFYILLFLPGTFLRKTYCSFSTTSLLSIFCVHFVLLRVFNWFSIFIKFSLSFSYSSSISSSFRSSVFSHLHSTLTSSSSFDSKNCFLYWSDLFNEDHFLNSSTCATGTYVKFSRVVWGVMLGSYDAFWKRTREGKMSWWT